MVESQPHPNQRPRNWLRWQHSGDAALWGRIRKERGAPAYWPWIQVLRTHVPQIRWLGHLT